MKKVRACVRPLLESIIYVDGESKFDIEANVQAPPGEVQWLRANSHDLLPTVVHAILQGLDEIVNGMAKDKQMRIIGWMLILSQHDWPRFSQKMRAATERIQREKSFIYVDLLNYIGESATLEELAWLHNQVMWTCFFANH